MSQNLRDSFLALALYLIFDFYAMIALFLFHFSSKFIINDVLDAGFAVVILQVPDINDNVFVGCAYFADAQYGLLGRLMPLGGNIRRLARAIFNTRGLFICPALVWH